MPTAGKLSTPDGRPIADATVCIVESGNEAIIQGLTLEDNLLRPQLRGTSDGDGNFHLPAADPSARLLVLHSAGYAIVKLSTLSEGNSIVLTPWAHVHGKLRRNGKLINDVRLELSDVEASKHPRSEITFDLHATSRIDGLFEFDCVPSMPCLLEPVDQFNNANYKASNISARPGETVSADLDADGGAASSKP